MASVGSTICHGCGYTEASGEVGHRCPRCGLAFVPIPEHQTRTDDAFLGRVLAGKYPLVGFVGAGTQGSVYRALQESVGREVVVKLIRPEFEGKDPINEVVRERFVREAKIVARLSSPSTVTLHDYGVDTDGTLFMVLELLRGKTLARVLSSEGFLPVGRAVGMLYQVLQSLAEAHGLGLVHRDLKPANIMVVKGPFGEDLVKVLDFGVARAESRDLTGRHATQAGTLIGTPRYMSPEQARGERAEPRSDLYAAGIILYELLCGRPPFLGSDPMEALLGHLEGEVPPLPAQYNVPPALELAIRKALAKDPAARFATAMEMAKALMDAREQKVSSPSAVSDALRASPRDQVTDGATSTLVREPTPAPASLGGSKAVPLVAPAGATNLPPRPVHPGQRAPTADSVRAPAPAPIQLSQPAPPAPAPAPEPLAPQHEEPRGASPILFAMVGVLTALAILTAVWVFVLKPKRPAAKDLIPDPIADTKLPAKLPSQAEPLKTDPVATPDPAKPGPAKPEPAKPDPAKPEPAKPEPAKPEPAKPEPAKPEPAKPEPAKPETAKPEPAKPEPAKPETAKPEPAKPEPAKPLPPPKPVVGYLDVTCTPACNVYLNGEMKGSGPLRNLALKPGEYFIWVKEPTTGAKDQRPVTITAGQRTSENFEL